MYFHSPWNGANWSSQTFLKVLRSSEMPNTGSAVGLLQMYWPCGLGRYMSIVKRLKTVLLTPR